MKSVQAAGEGPAKELGGLSIGIVGFGRIGAEHAAWIAAAGLSVAGVADATAARREVARERGLAVFDDAAGLLADRAVDAVLIATPTAMHFEQAAAAIRAGKHVMVEKPMCLDLPESRELLGLAREHGRVLSVFQCRRWDVDYLTVLRHVREGAFGKIINVESRLHQWSSCVGPAAREYRPNWRNERSFGGGGLYDWGSHFVDQLWRLMAPARPVRVFAQLRGNVWTQDCDDFARVCIDFDSGAVGLCEINTTTTQPGPRWRIDGTAGSGQAPCSLEFDTRRWAELEFSPASGGLSRRLEVASAGLGESDIWRGFARAIETGDPPPVPGSSVLATMALLDAARRSSAEGRAVEIAWDGEWTD